MENTSNSIQTQDILTEKLKKTLKDLKSLHKEMEKQNLDTNEIKKSMQKLESQISFLNPIQKSIKYEENYDKGLSFIFIFYSKQQKLVKNTSTFEDYYKDSTNLSVGEFLKFCKDFGIYSKEKLKKTELINIYKISCSWKKEMNENEFRIGLQYISNKIFDKSPKENLKSLCEFIHAEDVKYIKNKSKGFSLAFCNEKVNYRTPVMRIKLPSDKNLPRVSNLQIRRFQSEKSNSYHHKNVILPCDAIVADLKKNSYSSNLMKKMNPMSFTWQTLSSLPSADFQYHEKLNDLVSTNEQSDEEILEKYYGPLNIS
jgi:hypothetical protein